VYISVYAKRYQSLGGLLLLVENM